MATNLTRIRELAKKDRRVQFTNLYHHIYDVDSLQVSYDLLPSRRAVGVEGVSKSDYGKHLKKNLQTLSGRLRQMAYKPSAKRRSYIPKPGSPKGRPLGISTLEDKIVEESTRSVLEAIYEPMFESSSYGYRRGRGAHQCLDDLGRVIQQQRVSYVVEADIRSFFDTVNHDWLIKFLRLRVADERVLRLVHRMLKGGILEDGLVKPTYEGTPQGSILSPLLSNIYLHYVLDLWFRHVVATQSRGTAYFFRYADDFVACFEHREEAMRYYRALGPRLAKFGLQLAPEKTQCLAFGRFARERARRAGQKPAEFTFLGFTHYCGRTRNGYFKVKRRTTRKRMSTSLRAFTDWARRARGHLSKGEMLRSACNRLSGYLNYYAITDNFRCCHIYVETATRTLFKWLNRKSQRRAYSWETFNQVRQMLPWPKVTIRHNLDPCRR